MNMQWGHSSISLLSIPMEGKQSLQLTTFRKCKNRKTEGFTGQTKTSLTWDRVSSKCNRTDENTPSGTRGTFTHCEPPSAEAMLALSPDSVWLAASSLPSSLHEFQILKLPKFPCFPQLSFRRIAWPPKATGNKLPLPMALGQPAWFLAATDSLKWFPVHGWGRSRGKWSLLCCVSVQCCRTHNPPMSLLSGVQLEQLLLGW